MHRSRSFLRFGFLAILVASMGTILAAEEMPVPDSAVEAGLRDYLSKCDKANIIVKSELAPTYGYSDEDVLGYPHKYFRDCYYYWEGSYGQLIRETVSIIFRKVSADRWALNDYQHLTGETKTVQGPTKPLPEVPAQPTKEQITDGIKKYLAERYSLYEVSAVTKLAFSEPKFDWYGIDYEWGGYQYAGKVTFTWKKKSSGIGLGSLLAGKETKQGDCAVNMLYSIADKNWHAEFVRFNLVED